MPTETRRVIFGWPVSQGGVLHAVIDDYKDPADHPAPEVGPHAHSGDPQPWLRHARPLCSTGSSALMRVTPEHEFSPDGVAFTRGRVCQKCVPIWSARYAEAIPGFDRECRTCGQTRPINEFRADKRTADSISNVCETCRTAAARARAQQRTADEKAARHNARQRAIDASVVRQVARMTAWQSAAWTPKTRCVLEGHIMAAVVADGAAAWSCACGLFEVSEEVSALIAAAERVGVLSGGDPTIVWPTAGRSTEMDARLSALDEL